MITRINEFQAIEGEAVALGKFLSELQQYISGCFGCESCLVLQQPDNICAYAVIERWESEAAHKASLAGFPVEKMQAAMPLFGAPPRGAYYVVLDT